ncbi:MAG TPA: hypothetical protein VMS96_02315, partial [Terriglobales bacterium]|nr:hypothetical protein [Terriglobales bacterium]
MKPLAVVLLTAFFAIAPAKAQQGSIGSAYDAPAVNQAIGPTQLASGVAFEIATASRGEAPAALARRIVNETLRELANQLNPKNPPRIQLKLVLRMGQSHPYTKTLSGVEDGSEIGMVKWEPRLFARLVARAVRNSI